MVGDDPSIEGPGDVQIRTFLIADVRGYTLFTQERGDETAGKLAAKFARMAREGVEGRGGRLLELRGDEALCVFGSARQAIRAAVELQERFVEETVADPNLPLTVGIGIDAGEAVAVEGGYRGGALNLAARLCGQARAGEILASREVAHLARRVDGVRYEDGGALSLKGMAEPVHVIRVSPEGVDTVARLQPYAPVRPPEPRRRPRPWPAIAAAAIALVVIAAGLPLLLSDGGPIDIETNSIARIDAEGGSLLLTSELGQRPGASAIGFGSLWVAQPDRGLVARLSLEDGSMIDPSIRVGRAPSDVAIGEGAVWVTNAGDGSVSRIDVETNEVSQTIPAGAGPSGIAVGDGALWIADAIGGELLRVDPTSGETKARALAGQPSGVAFTPNGVWVSVAPSGIARVDPGDLNVTLTKDVGSGPTAVLPAFGSIWVANHFDDTVSRLEPSTGRVAATIPVGSGPNALGASAGLLWVASETDDSITAIDPATDRAERTLAVGGATTSLAADGDGLWLAVGASAAEHRGGTLIISASQEAFSSLDPSVVYDAFGWQILSFTNDGLMAYKRVGGPDGATLVPDLASSFPEVSSDGLTYRFPLREGIRYSTGEPVRPEDFRHGLERAISLSPDGASLFRDIDGADACAEEPSTCDLSGSIRVDASSVTIRLARPDPDLPAKLTLPFSFPIPTSVPFEEQGLDPVPATGPYMIAEAGPDGIELVRNPAFREWSASAQPDGFVDSISLSFNEPAGPAFDRLVAGEIDWMLDPPRPEDIASLQVQHPDRLVLSPNPITIYVGFDLRRSPVDDVRVRQAVNYAIDRDHLVELLGGVSSHRPTCQILPPNFQGYEPFCPYTLEPGSGRWSGPDVSKARALIEAAGVVGEEVNVWVMREDPFLGKTPPVMRYVTDVLNDIGLRAELTIKEIDPYFGVIYGAPSRHPPHVYLSGWATDYLGAANFIETQFRCGASANASGYCSDRLDARIREAKQLQQTDPAAANAAWIEIEHQLVREAVWAPLTNPLTPYAFSDRVGNVQVHPQWGLLLSRVWVR